MRIPNEIIGTIVQVKTKRDGYVKVILEGIIGKYARVSFENVADFTLVPKNKLMPLSWRRSKKEVTYDGRILAPIT